MRIIGVDCGWCAPGFAVVDIPEDLNLSKAIIRHVDCVITEKIKGRVSDDDARRIQVIVAFIRAMTTKFNPDLAIIELPIGGAKSAHAIKGMAMATAMTFTAFQLLNVPIVLLTPYENKRGSTGDPYAEKEDVITAVHSVWEDIPWPLKTLRKKLTVRPDERKQEAIGDALSTIVAYSKLVRSGKPPKTIQFSVL